MTFVIAEIGINHNGDLEIAKKLIDMAKECGADAVKFQKRDINLAYTEEFLDSPRESPWGTTQREQKEGLEFGRAEYDQIHTHCHKVGIPWLASAWDVQSQKFLKKYKLEYNKIASPMMWNEEIIKMVAAEGNHTFISTGRSSVKEISDIVEIFRGEDCPYTLMHCVNKYPCPDDECNLRMIPKLKAKFGGRVGYSNHNPSILATSLAVALGAEAIEVHITLDRSMYGSDQSASFEAEGLKRVVRDANRIGVMVG